MHSFLSILLALFAAQCWKPLMAADKCCHDVKMECNANKLHDMQNCDKYCMENCSNGKGGHCRTWDHNLCHCLC